MSNSKALAYTPYGSDAFRFDKGFIVGFNGSHRLFKGVYSLGLGYRFYNSQLMRFFNFDEESPFGRGGVNGYAYCGGDPINHIDPNGRSRLFFRIPRNVYSFVRGFFSPRPASRPRDLKVSSALHELVESQLNFGRVLFDKEPPSYRWSMAHYGVESISPPEYSIVPGLKQKTLDLNLGGRETNFSSASVGVFSQRDSPTKREKLERIYSGYAFYESATFEQVERARVKIQGYRLDDVVDALRSGTTAGAV
jgi:RHS repeat-associated protein